MGLTRPYEGSWYIGMLGKVARIVDGKIEKIPNDEQRGQKTLQLAEEKKLEFRVPVDLVIECECAQYDFDGDRLTWLRKLIEEKKPKDIMFIPACCGQMNDRRQEHLRQAFPGITMHFPVIHRDFCDNLHNRYDALCEELLRENVIG